MFEPFCIALVGIVVGSAPAETIEIHVAPLRDQLSGQAIVAETVSEALGLLGVRRADGDAGATRILIHDGRYEIEEPIVIDAVLAGDGLFIGATENSNPIISGGRLISGLRVHEDGTWRVVIDEVRRGQWWFEEVFADLEPRVRARHPNTECARVVTAGPDNRTSFTFDPAEIPGDALDTHAEVVFLHDWSTSRIRIANVETTTNTITVAAPIGCKAPHYAITNFERHPRYFIEGGISLVDVPGEWALNRDSGEFVYMPMPGERIENVRLIAPVAPALLRITGSIDASVSNVVVHGLRFAHVNWPIPPYGYAEGQASFYEKRDRPGSDGTRDAVPAAIELSWASGCHIDSCTIASVGGSGIWLGEGCRDCQVTDSIVRDTGANGIMLGEAASRLVEGEPWLQTVPEQAASGNSVRHFLVERCGRRFFGAVGVWIGLAERTTIANCEIRDLPYTGVSVGWRWDQTPTPCRENVIEANHIHHVMQTLSDGGGIYTLGRQAGTVLRSNAIHHIRRNDGRAPSNGIFFDQGTMDLLVEENVIWAIDTTLIRWHWTYENTVRNNTFVLRKGQQIAYYNRAKAEDITYQGNRTPDEATWSTDQAGTIIRGAGVQH
ncbi:MAG: right-handed parallel beta-helix repeat-containing protein [Phycisphaerales bacterium]|nr:right-handed parallel beta-helix repeat-containing protein [Phycisphaerales bacterium]